MTGADATISQKIDDYLGLYDEALPEVYGYVNRRVASTIAAEDVTAETFVAAMDTIQRGIVVNITIAWLIGIARHKVADHWRSLEREERRMAKAATNTHTGTNPTSPSATAATGSGQWDAVLDIHLAHTTLAELSTAHRSALSLRYLDGLPVGEVAQHLGRTPGATEALLTRAKAAFRAAYPEGDDHG